MPVCMGWMREPRSPPSIDFQSNCVSASCVTLTFHSIYCLYDLNLSGPLMRKLFIKKKSSLTDTCHSVKSLLYVSIVSHIVNLRKEFPSILCSQGEGMWPKIRQSNTPTWNSDLEVSSMREQTGFWACACILQMRVLAAHLHQVASVGGSGLHSKESRLELLFLYTSQWVTEPLITQ